MILIDGLTFNLKAVATAADPSEGKNWSKFEKKIDFSNLN